MDMVIAKQDNDFESVTVFKCEKACNRTKIQNTAFDLV